jgi:CHAT domain-containing protein
MAAFDADRRALDRLLGLHDLPDGQVVLVPSASLNGAPWAALPSLAGRPVTVTPSATVWTTGRARPPGGDGACFVAGPDLPAAAAEVATAAACHPGAEILRGDDATVARVVTAFSSHRVLHVAAHGRFRSDSPLFSGLELADGALALFDLDGVPAAPEVVVLPACHLASSRLLPGEEPLGAVATLVRLGVGTVIAPAGVVADDATAGLMVDLHRHLVAGRAPADALAAASSVALDTADPTAVASAALFVATGRR